jgi:hypothetical protein
LSCVWCVWSVCDGVMTLPWFFGDSCDNQVQRARVVEVKVGLVWKVSMLVSALKSSRCERLTHVNSRDLVRACPNPVDPLYHNESKTSSTQMSHNAPSILISRLD